MNLPYVRKPEYLSPTALFEGERDPWKFYLKRLGPLEWKPPPFKQTGPMAVGSVFDGHVKTVLAAKLGLEKPLVHLREQVDEDHLASGSPVPETGLNLFRLYRESPAWQALLADGLDSVETPVNTMEVGGHIGMVGVRYGGVPIWGKPDAAMTSPKGLRVILDWKVNGAFSESGASPKKGYLRMWDKGVDVGPHREYGHFLENIDEYWAAQCAMYYWMLTPTHELKDNAWAAIEQVVVRHDWIRFAQYRAPISPEFQQALLKRLKTLWDHIQNETLLEGVELPKDDLEMMRFLV